jgi:hypothetical protein
VADQDQLAKTGCVAERRAYVVGQAGQIEDVLSVKAGRIEEPGQEG